MLQAFPSVYIDTYDLDTYFLQKYYILLCNKKCVLGHCFGKKLEKFLMNRSYNITIVLNITMSTQVKWAFKVLQRHFLKGLHTGKKDGSQDTIVELFPSPRSPWIIVHAAHGKHSGSFSKNPTSSIS